MAFTSDGYRPSTPEELAEDSRRIRAAFEPKPLLVPYEAWSAEIDALHREEKITLARPTNFSPSTAVEGEREGEEGMTILHLIHHQELFYRDAYADPTFTIDRAKLALPSERLDDIKAALLRREVDYPLVVATPSVIPSKYLPNPSGRTSGERRGRTIHRVLLDLLIRKRRIKVWKREAPNLNTFLAQLRDLTTTDLTRTDLKDPDGKLLRFEHDPALGDSDPNQPWLRYLQALYSTLPRPAATPGYTDLSFVKWEQDLPASRIIHGAHGPRGGQVTIQEKSQIDAVSFRYPLITPSRHLALFSQYHAATGQHLDTSTWSWTFGIVDPQRFSDGPSVYALCGGDQLGLNRNLPGDANTIGRLRSSR